MKKQVANILIIVICLSLITASVIIGDKSFSEINKESMKPTVEKQDFYVDNIKALAVFLSISVTGALAITALKRK